jgi:two-component system, NtrC family, response regulator AtoC
VAALVRDPWLKGMTKDHPDRNDTVPLSRRRPALQGVEAAFSLLVYHRDGVGVVPLAVGVPVTIGRAPPADIAVPDKSLSRCHARFTLQRGLVVTVEDLGSTNGTLFRGEHVRRAEVRPGDTVTLGAVIVSPHMRATVEPEIAGLASHDAFCAALEGELMRARYFDEPLSVLLLQPLGATDGKGHVSEWWRHMREALRPVDSAALYSPRAVELAVARLDGAAARDHAAALLRLAPRPSRLGCGIATYPDSGTTADEILEASRRALSLATAEVPVVLSPPVRAPAPEISLPTGPVIVSPAMRAVFDLVDRLAGARLPVLLLGETGSGKEVVARAIHERSPRSRRPMVCVNCSAIPATLLESTLFGHRKGAFTGANEASEGVFGFADGGTVLLDEVGELALGAQAALLRVLEQGHIRPVGASDERAVDVRVIAATHRDLEAMCEAGSFRRDLFHRLEAFTVSIPPLRERPEDIEPLVRHFLADAVNGGALPRAGVSPDAMSVISRYDWPGNVRELRNAIERAAVIARSDFIGLDDLPRRVRDAVAPELSSGGIAADHGEELALGEGGLREHLRRYERHLIIAALERSAGNQTEAARMLEVPVRTLADKIRRLGIQVVSGHHKGGR